MRFYTNFRDLFFLFDIFSSNPAKGIVILCFAVIFALLVGILYNKKRN